MIDKAPPVQPAKAKPKMSRSERLAEALRANLKRRKSAARSTVDTPDANGGKVGTDERND
jgi:hypothetical protein